MEKLKTNKLVIFDLDGVLLDSREIHYEALNRALELVGPEFVISQEEHLSYMMVFQRPKNSTC